MAALHLGYVPDLRDGALIFTVIVLRYILSGCTNQGAAFAEVYGSPHETRSNIFGARVRFTTTALFAGAKPLEEVLMKHTLLGIYSRTLTQDSVDFWIKSVTSEWKRGQPRRQFRRYAPAMFHFATSSLRSCKTCVRQDMEEFGFPSWHLLHVLPPLFHCPYHGDALIWEGASGSQATWDLKLPTGTSVGVPRCEPVFASEGYAAYLRRWIDVLDGRLTILSAETWPNYIDAVVRGLGGIEEAKSALSSQISRSWGVHIDQLHPLLGHHLHRYFVQDELEHRAIQVRIAQKLIVLDACELLGFRCDDGTTIKQMDISLPQYGVDTEHYERKRLLRPELIVRGIPLVLLAYLSDGSSASRIAAKSDVAVSTVRRVMALLSSALLEELHNTGSWSAESWLTEELRRRERPVRTDLT